jgi:hypothetical protein
MPSLENSEVKEEQPPVLKEHRFFQATMAPELRTAPCFAAEAVMK